jgi:hypothetical protein
MWISLGKKALQLLRFQMNQAPQSLKIQAFFFCWWLGDKPPAKAPSRGSLLPAIGAFSS